MSLSALGDHLAAVALTWVAVQVFGAQAGYLSALQALVLLLALLGVGRWADRWDHWRGMIGADLCRAAVLAAVVVGWRLSSGPGVTGLMAVIVVLGLGQAVFRPALQAVMPSLAGDPGLLPAANALLDATDRSARLIGPGLVAMLGALIPLEHFFTLDALSFVASAAALRLIGRTPSARPARVAEGVWQGMLRGGRALGRHPLLGYVLAMSAPVSGIWYAVYFLGLPLLIAQRRVHGPDGSELGAYGLVLSAYGCTNLAATIVFGGRPMPLRPQFQMFGGTALVGLGIVLTGLAGWLPQAWLLPGLAVGAAAGAAGGPMKDILVAVMRQTRVPAVEVPAGMRAYMALNALGMLAGMVLAPLAFEAAGVVPVIVGCGVLMAGLGVTGMVRHAGWIEPPAGVAVVDRVLASR